MPERISRCTLSNCACEATGPRKGSFAGSPTVSASAARRAISTASPRRWRGTSMRVGALQDWPALAITALTPPATARSRSASSRMRFGDLPPSSWHTRLTVGAAARATSIPARVEPVKETRSIPPWAAMAAPTTGPSPSTRLKAPAGTPASCRMSATMWAEKGATSEGFSTTVQPAASAGASLAMSWFSGQFQGVIRPQTPTGSRRIRVAPRAVSNR